MLTLKAFLLQQPPSFVPPVSDRTASKSTVPKNPTKVEKWPDFLREINEYQIDDSAAVYRPSTFIKYPSIDSATEGSVQYAFISNVLKMAEYSDLAVTLGFPHNSNNFNISRSGQYIIGEVKYPNSKILQVDCLVDQWDKENSGLNTDNIISRHLRRLYGYLVEKDLEYGILTVYCKNWFVRRSPADQRVLWISPALTITSSKPSVAQCIWVILNKPCRALENIPAEKIIHVTTEAEDYEEDTAEGKSISDTSTSDPTFHPSSRKKKQKKDFFG